jgi:hypothetical protein
VDGLGGLQTADSLALGAGVGGVVLCVLCLLCITNHRVRVRQLLPTSGTHGSGEWGELPACF